MKNISDTTSILKELIKIKSYSGQEEKLAKWIINFAKQNNISYYQVADNVVLIIKNNAKKCLIFDGHMDTVKEGNIASWDYPPFGEGSGTEKDNKIYGLGASDMKGSLACFLTLAKNLNKQKLSIDLFFVFVVQEEITGQGSKDFVKNFTEQHLSNYDQIGVIIGESTDNKILEIGHKGNVFIKIITHGESGHSSKPPEIKTHAIHQMIKVISQMEYFKKNVLSKFNDPILGKSTICLTNIKTPDIAINQIPNQCTSTWDIRTTPKIHFKTKDLVSDLMGSLAQIEYAQIPAPSSLTPKGSYLVKLFQQVLPNIKISCSSASNDSCFFTQAGIETVVFGPGSKKIIHKENEFIEIKNLKKALAIYKKIIEQF